MPQTSIAYATARIVSRVHESLDNAHVERMIAAESMEDARRVLVEYGLASADGTKDAEAVADARLKETCMLIKKLSPCKDTTDCFLLRYDGMNIKMLVKARMLGRPVTSLSGCGVLDPQTLQHAVADRKYDALPELLGKALTALEDTLATQADPLLVDQTVDQAIYAMIQTKLRHVKSRVVRHYFMARVDLLNAIMALRIHRMGRDAAFARDMMLPGGRIAGSEWAAMVEDPTKIRAALAPYGNAIVKAATLATENQEALPQLEKAMEDALLAPFLALKGSVYRIEPLFGYLLGVEREATAIRLILAGHASGVPQGMIRERVRDVYGG